MTRNWGKLKLRCADNIITFHQGQARAVYNSVPAHVLDIQVIELDNNSVRNGDIWTYFQDPSKVRTIDLRSTDIADEAMEEEEDSMIYNTTKGLQDEEDLKDTELKNAIEMEKEEEENLELVRFQYDGVLKIDVRILGDRLNCDSYNNEYAEGDSFHVLSSMEQFLVKVDLFYDLTESMPCDIVDTEDLKLQITNNIGADPQSDAEFLSEIGEESKELLLKCANGCLRDIVHDTDICGKLSNAHSIEWFAAGPPNGAHPFEKKMSFKVQMGPGNIVSEYEAVSVVEGVISNGNAKSFALPTHKPIMILRDPPGGLSYASYKNNKRQHISGLCKKVKKIDSNILLVQASISYNAYYKELSLNFLYK